MIGYMATAVDGGRVPLITDCRHSVTTQGRHINPAHRATSYKAFVVPSLRALNHEVNLASLVKRYDEAKAKFLRAINNEDADFCSWLDDCLAEARRYAESFGLEAPKRDVGRDMGEIRADHERRRARRETPAYLAKKAREMALREAREAESRRIALLSYNERMAEWLAGANVRPVYNTIGAPVRLRVKGDTLETSLGAVVPLADAIKVFYAVARCRRTGTEWNRNGHAFHVGQFQIDRIEANGNFHAGCHHIEWSECERVAKLAGVSEEA